MERDLRKKKKGIKNMNELTIFENEQFGKMRTMMIDDEPWFATIDVCRSLEVSNPSQALKRLDPDELLTTVISNESAAADTPFMSFVNESGLYTLILDSSKPKAKEFKRWVTHEVLPSIRKHGLYATDDVIDKFLEDPRYAAKLFSRACEKARQNQAARNGIGIILRQASACLLFFLF